MFDLTKEVPLDKKNYRTYRKWQKIVYAIAVFCALYLTYVIIFPTVTYTFSFDNPQSGKNSNLNPANGAGILPEHGNIKDEDSLVFSKVMLGNYSKAKVNFTMDKDSTLLEDKEVAVKKSYRSFLYPDGNPIGFKDGTLVRSGGNYYIISQGKARKFSSDTIINNLGFRKESFIDASQDDLKYNEKGEDISSETYPDDTIFEINGSSYLLEDQKLKKFVSQNAFLTQYSNNQAIAKDQDFLKNYPLDENLLGFADGTLISYGISAFIVSSGKIMPIDNTTTFVSKGFDWNDIISASGDEIALYQKDKLFNLDSPHPDGTIFATEDSSEWYLVKNNQKHLLSSQLAALTWNRTNPILVNKKSLEVEEKCQLKKNFFNSRKFSCTMPIDNLKDLIGLDYQFKMTADDEIIIDNLDVSFSKEPTWENFKLAIIGLITKIKGNYVPQSATPIQ